VDKSPIYMASQGIKTYKKRLLNTKRNAHAEY